MSSPDIAASVAALADALQARGQRLVAAESCTGGLIAAACTARAGSSLWFDRGFVTYSNAAKTDCLGVDPALIAAHGAVSSPVAQAMAEGALRQADAHWAVAVTGIAGPGGGSADKPVGTVWLAVAAHGRATHAQRCHFDGDRDAVRAQTVARALAMLRDALGQPADA